LSEDPRIRGAQHEARPAVLRVGVFERLPHEPEP
jgi:hypothetical protein